MSARKYSFAKMTDEQMDALAAKFPRAVEIKTVTVRKPVYSVIAKLLDCGVDVPGIALISNETAEENSPVINSEPATPAFLKGMANG